MVNNILKMPSKPVTDENMVFLFKCIEASGCKMDFKLIGDAVGIKPPAARMRYTRLKKSVESGTYVPTRSTDIISLSPVERVVSTPKSTPRRKHFPSKWFDESSEEEEELEPVKKKRFAAEKQAVADSDASYDDNNNNQEIKTRAKMGSGALKKHVEQCASYSRCHTDDVSYYTAKEVLPEEDAGDDTRKSKSKNAVAPHDKASLEVIVAERAQVNHDPPTTYGQIRDIRAAIETPDTLQHQTPRLSAGMDDQWDLDARIRGEMDMFQPGLRVGTVRAQIPPTSARGNSSGSLVRTPVRAYAQSPHAISGKFGEDAQSTWSQGDKDMISPDDSISAVESRRNASDPEEQISIHPDRKRGSPGSMIARITSLWG